MLRAFVLILMVVAVGAGQDVVFNEQVPLLPRSGETFTYRLRLSAPAAGLRFRPDPTGPERDFTNVGNNTWQIQMTAPTMRAIDVYSRFVGLAVLPNGNVVSNVIIHARNEAMPAVRLTRLADDLQRSDYVVNVVSPSFYGALFNGPNFFTPNPQVVMRRVYQTIGDDYDFVHFQIASQMALENRYHIGLKNTTAGIGVPMFDQSADYGARGKVLGLTMFPNPHFIDAADSSISHELGHQWIQFVSDPALPGRPHWPISTMATGIMG